MEQDIRALFTFEIMGRPPEHIKSTMEQLINKLSEIPGINIDKSKIHETKKVEDEKAKNLYTTFSEVEVLAKDVNSIMTLVFHSMPSHIEIIKPQEFAMKNFDISTILTNITSKLHRYDEIAKTIVGERNMLIKKLKQMQTRIKELEGESKENKQEIKKIEKNIKPKKKTKKKTKSSKKK